TIEPLRTAALRQPGAHERASGMIKFQCPKCAAEGHDTHDDNARLFINDGKWGCAFASSDTAKGRAHWEAIGQALGAFTYRHPRASRAPAPDATLASGLHSVWGCAIAVPVFLEEAEEPGDFLRPRLLVRGAITELYSPRGLGQPQGT